MIDKCGCTNTPTRLHTRTLGHTQCSHIQFTNLTLAHRANTQVNALTLEHRNLRDRVRAVSVAVQQVEALQQLAAKLHSTSTNISGTDSCCSCPNRAVVHIEQQLMSLRQQLSESSGRGLNPSLRHCWQQEEVAPLCWSPEDALAMVPQRLARGVSLQVSMPVTQSTSSSLRWLLLLCYICL